MCKRKVKEKARRGSYSLKESHYRTWSARSDPDPLCAPGFGGRFPMPWREKPLSSQRQTLWASAWQCCQKLRWETSVSFLALSDMTKQSTVLSLTLFPCWDIPLTWNASLNSFRGHILSKYTKQYLSSQDSYDPGIFFTQTHTEGKLLPLLGRVVHRRRFVKCLGSPDTSKTDKKTYSMQRVGCWLLVQHSGA